MALVNYGSSSEDSDESDNDVGDQRTISELESDSVEPEYRMRVPKSAKVSFPIPDLVKEKLKSGKVLLSIPSLDTLDSSDDDDDDDNKEVPTGGYSVGSSGTNRTIRKSANQPGRGLLSLLPPAHCAHGQKPVLMIPPQLTTKRPVTVRSTKSNEDPVIPTEPLSPISTAPKDVSDESDGDESSTTYFSFYKAPEETAQSVASVRAEALNTALQAMTSSSVPATATVRDDQDVSTADSPKARWETPSFTGYSMASQSKTKSLCSIDPEVLKQFDVPKQPHPDGEDEDAVSVQLWTEQTFVPAPERKRARLTQPGIRSLPISAILHTSNQLVREVNQADLTAGADIELIKSVTSDESQYVSQRAAADDDPGKLAHRKHQITWLAHQAQANEMELEKRWSEARRNKATSRAKYGF